MDALVSFVMIVISSVLGSAIGYFVVGAWRSSRLSDLEGEVGSALSRLERLELRAKGDKGRDTQIAMREEMESAAAMLPALLEKVKAGEKPEDLLKQLAVSHPTLAKVAVQKLFKGQFG